MKKRILINDLLINTENPRFEHQDSQHEAILNMISTQKSKIINLANHILNNGLNPAELTIVKQDSQNRYIVLEGNRRVIALKLLANPEILDDSDQFKEKSKFNEMHKKFIQSPIDEVECVVFKDEKEANEWIKIKHTGENEGVGIVKWNAQQVARFEEKTKSKKAIALDLLDFLNGSECLNDELKMLLANVPVSSLDRLIRDKNVQDTFGFKISDNKIITELPEEEFVKGFKKIVFDLANKEIRVKDIYTKKDREDYLDTFDKDDIPNKSEIYDKPWPVSSESTEQKAKRKQQKKKRSNTPSTARKTLIPRNCVINVNEYRINKIYWELKRIEIEKYTNAVAVLFRVFVELSLDAYIEVKKMSNVTVNSKLTTKTEKIVEMLKEAKLINEQQSKGILNLPKTPNSYFSINTFNAYVHNKDLQPIANDLKLSWDNIQKFIEILWGELE